jgi:hypothetical protein
MDIKQNKGLTRNTIDKFYTKDISNWFIPIKILLDNLSIIRYFRC